MLSDDIVARIVASIPEPISDDAATWVSDLCFAIEAEVRKQDEALIRQMLEAMSGVNAMAIRGEPILWTAEFDKLRAAMAQARRSS